jgi:aminopeptidase YwaD
MFLESTSVSKSVDATSEPSFLPLISQVNESTLRSYHTLLMSFGSRYTGSENCSNAADWIYNTLLSMRLDVYVHHWEYSGFTSQNIVATIPGTNSSSTIEYIFSAHYDCTPGSLGADDDGSGIASLLAIAEILQDQSFPYTIKFIAFSGEEVGTFGSFCYARDAYRNQDNIRAVINPDMIGYADTPEGGRTLRFFYPERSEWIARFAQETAIQYNPYIDMKVDALPNYIGADHQAFVDYGYDGVWVAHQDSYPWANTPEDTPDHINYSYLTKATKLLLVILAELASAPVPVNIQLISPYEGYGYINEHPVVTLDLGKQWYWGVRGITLLIGSAPAKAVVETNSSIRYVVFCVDHNFQYWDSALPYEWHIEGKHFPLIGKHTLQVMVYTTDNQVATDEMDFISYSMECQYC